MATKTKDKKQRLGEPRTVDGKPAVVFPKLGQAEVRLAAIQALAKLTQGDWSDHDFDAQGVRHRRLPAPYAFAFYLMQGFGPIEMMEACLCELDDVIAALVRLAAGETSPEWDREHVVRKEG